MFNKLIDILEKYKYQFISDSFKLTIKNYIRGTFTNLNNYDINVLSVLTVYIIEDITIRYDFYNNPLAQDQWTQNNARDIISICQSLLPFVKDENYSKLTSLKILLYKNDSQNVSNEVLQYNIKTGLKNYFPYCNFSLGLLNKNENNMLELYEDGLHLIYKSIHYNFISMLETIKITNGKLCINWINTIPLVDYKNSNFYKNSIIEINNIIDNTTESTIFDTLNNNKYLWLGDYYNVITNGYYISIKNIKWVIFCRKITSSTKYYYSIQYLNNIFDIDNMFNHMDYNSMDDHDKHKFKSSLTALQKNMKNNIATFKDIYFELDLFKNLFIFMVNNFSDKKKLLTDYPIFKKFIINISITEEDLDEDEESWDNMTDTAIHEALLIDPSYLWKYIKETLVELKSSIYGKYLIQNNTINMNIFNFETKNKESVINLKNIYNISKLLCHNKDPDNFLQHSVQYKGLDKQQILIFFYYFCSKRFELNIPRNIELQEGDEYDDKEYKTIINKIINGWNEIKINLIWDYLSYNGLLSEFRINVTRPHMIFSELKKFFHENPKIFKENYYMTNDTYDNLSIYSKEDPSNLIKYSKLLIKSLKHYSFYANDYISMLNTFNHYINHSIIYVTGSTGTGKSTQLPKLVLYALKMYDYKNNGKIICTQPRIEPTQNNTKRIAAEMGLNIIDVKNNIDYKTNNYYLQYKHNKGQHTKELCSHLTLRMVTDGTLLEELITNPLLKHTFKKSIKNVKEKDGYGYVNKYDVVIIDEAHEHNANMDLILTLMRQTCLYNNGIRLIIVSATMDDDEPIYRYYYKLINDNIMYPIKRPLLKHPILEEESFLIDAIYTDRRMNISPPGKSTQYNVTEFYDELIEKEYGLDEKINYSIAAKSSYKTIMDICNKSISGDILLFSVGKQEIIESVNYLNNILPNGVIALPYYSEMADRYRDIISNINTMIHTIKNKRNMIGEQWGAEYIVSNDVSQGTYKRAVIIATNVAEASITIESLKYVVDTGYSKVNRFDIILDTSTINIEKISESSRIQRKGRVGRVREGIVYFTYGKNKRLDVMPKYDITVSDFHSNYLKMASKNDESNLYLLWENNLSPYLPYQFMRVSQDINDILQTTEADNFKKYNLLPLLESQFLIDSAPIPIEYFHNFNEYSINKSVLPKYFNRYPDGYLQEQLIDNNGSFYIIHPFEDRISRNITGEIIQYKYKLITKTNDNIHLDDKVFTPLLINMSMKMLYMNVNNETLIGKRMYKKTNYSDKINEMRRAMNNMNEQESIIILMSAGYNIVVETCMVISMIKAISMIQPTISALVKKTGKILQLDKLQQLFGSNSDITSLYMICSRLSKILHNLELFRFIELYKNGCHCIDKSSYRKQYDDLVILYRKKLYNRLGDTIENSAKCYNLLNWLHNNGRLDNTTGYLTWLSKSNILQTKIKNDIILNHNLIKQVCDQFYLDFNIIIKYFHILLDNFICIISSDKDIDTTSDENVFTWGKRLSPYLLKNLTNNTIEYKLNLCFFFGNPIIAVKNNNNYMNLRNGGNINVNMIFGKMNTLCNQIGSYIYFFTQSNNMMYLIASIDPFILPKYYAIYYNPHHITTTYKINDNNNSFQIIQFNNSEWERLVYIVRNNWSFINFPFNNIEIPVMAEYIKNVII